MLDQFSGLNHYLGFVATKLSQQWTIRWTGLKKILTVGLVRNESFGMKHGCVTKYVGVVFSTQLTEGQFGLIDHWGHDANRELMVCDGLPPSSGHIGRGHK